MRKKTYLEQLQDRVNGNSDTSVYTDKEKTKVSNSSVRNQVDNLYNRNKTNIQQDDIWERVKARANDILNDNKNIIKNLGIGISSSAKNGLYYIENSSENIFSNYKKQNQLNAKLKRDKEEKEKIINGNYNNINKTLSTIENLHKENKMDKFQNPILQKAKENLDLKSPILEGFENSILKDEEKIQKNIENSKTKVGKKVAELMPSIGQSVSGMVAGMVNPTLGLAYFQTSAGGNYTREAKAKGLNEKQAMTYGTIMGAMESITESIGAKLTTGVGKSVFKDGAKEGLKAFGLDVAENFFEEAIMEPIQETVMKATGGQADWSNMAQRMWNSGIDGALTSVIMGGASAGIGKATKLITKIENGQQIKQEDIVETLKEINDSEEVDIEKLLVNSFQFTAEDLIRNTDVQKSTNEKLEKIASEMSQSEKEFLIRKNQQPTIKNEQILNNNQQVNHKQDKNSQNQFSSEIEENKQNQVNIVDENQRKLEKVLQKDKYKENQNASNFFKSANENNLDISNEKIESLFDLPNARGIKTEFNQEMFKDQNGNIKENINAIYVTDSEGNRNIIYNPKANQENIVEKNVIHETFHDMAGTKEAQEITDFVYNKIKDTTDFQDAFNSLKEVYSQVTDNEGRILYNSESVEFENMIKEEAVADYLGQNLGTQEYINELVNGKESRNVAQKIYDAIVKFLDKVTGYKSEEAYLRGLKDKFEKAFNSEYANSNEQTKYSIAGKKAMENAINKDSQYKIIEESYNKALKMAKENVDNEQIRQKTNWFQDKNRDWKFEFSDKDMKLKKFLKENSNYKLGDILNHDILFDLYPELKQYNVETVNLRNNAKGSHVSSKKTIYISNKLLTSNQNIEATLIHEIQHAIQKSENFEGGKSTNKSKLAYYNSLGEIEASDVSKRFIEEKYNKKDLSNILPESSKKNPKHSNLDNYLENRGIVDKIKDKVYSGLKDYLNQKSEDYNESFEENNSKNNNQNSNMVVERRRYLKDNTSNKELENNSSSFSLQENRGKWQEFLDKNTINKEGTRTTLRELKKLPQKKEIKLPTFQESQYQDIINNAKYIPKKEKANLLSELDGVEKNNESLKDFKSIVEEMDNTYKQLDDDLLKKQTYNTGNKEIYQSYLKETSKYDTKAIDKALKIIPANSQGKRTKEQWTNIAKQIGLEVSNKSNIEIQEIAFRSWQDLRPSSKEALNRQGQKYVEFNSDNWVNTIYEQVEQARTKFSISEVNKKDIILPGSKKIESNRAELPTNLDIYKDEDVRAFKYATDNIGNIKEESNFVPPEPPDNELPDTKIYISDKRSKNKLRKKEILDSLTQQFVNKGHYIDKLAKDTGNKELTYKYDRTLSTFNEAQYSIGNEQINSKGEVVGESLLEIFKPIEKAKLEKDFEDYLLNKHNISRSITGKSIYGDDVSAPQSKKIVEKYETKYPQFKEWSEKVSKYNRNTLKDMADIGMISEDTYNNLRMLYGDYVPTYRDIVDEKIIFDDGSVGGNVLGRATKSNKKILSPKEAMAEQTLAVKKAIRVNELGVELYKTLGKDSKIFEGIDFDATAIQTLGGDVIQKAQDGMNTFTIFINGKSTQFKISDELYTAFSKDTFQSRIQNNKALNAILTPVEKLSKTQRNLLTTYSIGFAFNNPIKDIQDAVFNTKYSVARFSKNYVKALYQIGIKGNLYKQYLRDGGSSNTYFEYNKGLLPQKNKIRNIIDKVQVLNETLEMAPRLAEYMSTIENGGTKAEALYNSAEITTNFKRGGEITKAINKYGANFLNASVQGMDKQIRNIIGANGIKGYAQLITRATIFGIGPAIINHLILSEDDDKEYYEDLPDYIKDGYYLIPKGDEGEFYRIPKGRVIATLGITARNITEAMQGKKDVVNTIEASLKGLADNLAPNNPLKDNLVAPILQAKNNKAWYNGEIENTRLQKLPVAERTDEKTDKLSNKVSEVLQSNSLTKYIADKLGISPKKLNYVIDQYSGGIGDVILPMVTPYAENNILTDKFTTDAVLKNKKVEEFYTVLQNIEISKNSEYSTDTDKLQYKYLNGISKNISDLYAEKRKIQNSNLKDKEKKEKSRNIQKQINQIIKEALSTLDEAKITNSTASFNGIQYYKDEEDTWKVIKEDDFTNGLSIETYADYKNKLSIASNKKKKEKNDKNATLTTKEKVSILKSTTYSDKEKKEIYLNVLGKNDEIYKTISKLEDGETNIDEYLDYKIQNFESDENTKSNIVGKKVSKGEGTSKNKTLNYINNSNMTDLEKAYIVETTYPGVLNSKTLEELTDIVKSKITDKEELEEVLDKFKDLEKHKDDGNYYKK